MLRFPVSHVPCVYLGAVPFHEANTMLNEIVVPAMFSPGSVYHGIHRTAGVHKGHIADEIGLLVYAFLLYTQLQFFEIQSTY